MPRKAVKDRRPLFRRLRSRPRPGNRETTQGRLVDLEAQADETLRALLAIPRLRTMVAGIADHSPFLWGLIEADPLRFRRLLEADPTLSLERIFCTVSGGALDETEAEIMRRLRRARQELALLVGFADLSGVWALDAVVQALSKAADLFIGAALSWILRQAHAQGKLALDDLARPQERCGVCVLGLGKLGGLELNYSSDVDLMVIFDPDSPAIVRRDQASSLFARLVRDLVRLLQSPTGDGYVLRVDLRLRPDPGSTAPAIGLNAAFNYYEALGQNWERAALIKARPVAGDLALGKTFIEGLSPFIWRRYFDFATIADIHAMKRQIHAAKGHADIAVAGHNVKLGRGGIREIEFFVQTQQLIFGGKRPALRGSRTISMLRQLRRDRWISRSALADLARAYAFLRRVEHRLQMVADEQTHRIPKSADDLERFARFFGFASAERFAVVLTRHLRAVVKHYAALFEHEPDLGADEGSLVFTGTAEDADTLETLTRLGFRDASTVWHTIREWHAGKRAGIRTPRSRETLTTLLPNLLVSFSKTFEPDAAVAGLDRALERMPAAAELFAILNQNASLLDLFGEILGSAPRLAEVAASSPHLFDAMIGPQAEAVLDDEEMEAIVARAVVRARSTEEVLDLVRDVQHEEHFLIGAKLLSGALGVEDAGRAYGALAVATMRVLLANLVRTFCDEHGRIPGGALAMVAMGKLGSREMTATSDLDLVLIYDFDTDHPQSDGQRSLHATQYYARLTKRLLSYLTVATRRGKLYEVDMRLRPSGRQGPLATKLSAFEGYQNAEAATWEHMALTRARVVAGDPGFAVVVTDAIKAIFDHPPPEGLARDIVAMRSLIEREKPATSPWDLKLIPGGLIDIEFVAQYLVLRHASRHPTIADPSTQAILQNARRLGLIPAAHSETLTAYHALYTNVTQIMRLALEEAQTPDRAGRGLQQRLADVAGLPDFARLKSEIESSRQAVRDLFNSFLSGD